MEYSKDGKTWTTCSYYGNTTKVPLDKKSANSPIYKDTVYYVRYRDTETQKVSEAATVTVPRYTGVVAVPVPRTDMVYRNRGYFVFEGDPDYYKAHYITVEGTYIHTKAGTYTVKVKPEDGYTWEDGTTDPVTLTVTIAKRTATASDFEVISCPTLETDYTGKAQTYEMRFAWPESPFGHRLKFANPDNKLTLKYKVEETGKFVTEPIDVGTYTLYIDVPDDPNFNATTVTDKDGRWTFTIVPADMKVPTGVTGVAATKEHPTKGQLTGLGTDMEYRVKGSETWTAATGNTVDVTLNTENGYPVDTVFEVRYKADKNHDTSSPAQVTVKAYQCVEHVYGETLVSDETSHWHQCTVCGAKTGIAAHSYTDKKFDGNGHWAVCACGAETHHDKHSLTAKHNESQHWQECVCGYKTGETAHELTSKYDTAGHWQECECGYATDKTDHSMESKSSADGHWDACACGYKTDVAAHAWTDKFDTQNHWQECSGCGYQKDVTAHSLTKNVNETQHQVKCENCGYKTEWENHTGGTATCTAKAVGGVPDGLSQRRGAEHADGAAALRRKHRFPRGVRLGGQTPGAVSLHQHKVGGGLPAGEARRGELALRSKGAGADDGAAGKGRAQSRLCVGKGAPVRTHDVGGGGQQHRATAGQLLRQNAQEGGLAAAADHRRQAGADIQ